PGSPSCPPCSPPSSARTTIATRSSSSGSRKTGTSTAASRSVPGGGGPLAPIDPVDERAHRRVEPGRRLPVALLPDAVKDHEGRRGDRLVDREGDMPRRADVLGAVYDEGRCPDRAELVAEVAPRHGPEHRARPGGADVLEHLPRLREEGRVRVRGEE